MADSAQSVIASGEKISKVAGKIAQLFTGLYKHRHVALPPRSAVVVGVERHHELDVPTVVMSRHDEITLHRFESSLPLPAAPVLFHVDEEARELLDVELKED